MTVLDVIMLSLFAIIFGGAFAMLMGFRPNMRRWNPMWREEDGASSPGGGRNRNTADGLSADAASDVGD